MEAKLSIPDDITAPLDHNFFVYPLNVGIKWATAKNNQNQTII